ncbi:LPS assembly lipoprotein LptE [Membranihabitans marinus]|uniref:LPS assembly lipoprotein LptE n=1 Tax=Membranihabitans marinus TaxID=1227546 RepID=UPI001F0099A6|nr:LPS assembly lipoprotein LptE [Membranihabitans marinus]
MNWNKSKDQNKTTIRPNTVGNINLNKLLRSLPFIAVMMVFVFNSCLISCYSFKGVSIPQEVNTFYIPDFKISNRALKAPRELGVQFADQLKQQILRESRLAFSEENPDIEFSGEINRFAIVSVAPQPDETTAFSRLDISIKVNYKDHRDEENDWEKTFSDFRNFDRSENFLDVQDGLVDQIFEQIGEDIFNQTFSNW